MFYKRFLIESLYEKTGILIQSKNDCRRISQLIAKEKSGYISESTLYRIFLHEHQKPNNPYKATLLILVNYCGFKDWNSFLTYHQSQSLHQEPSFLNESIDAIIRNLIARKKFSPLIDIFESLENETYKTKEFFGLKTFKHFQKTDLFPQFISSYGDHHFVRNILLESLYDPFHRINGYTESIEQYLKSTSSHTEHYFQDVIFAKTVLFRHHYLNKDQKTLEIGKEIYEISENTTNIQLIHLFPRMRFLAYKIWYISLSDGSVEDYLQELHELIEQEFKRILNLIDLNIIYQTIMEVLLERKLHVFKEKIDLLVQQKLEILHISQKTWGQSLNSNGLINFIPT